MAYNCLHNFMCAVTTLSCNEMFKIVRSFAHSSVFLLFFFLWSCCLLTFFFCCCCVVCLLLALCFFCLSLLFDFEANRQQTAKLYFFYILKLNTFVFLLMSTPACILFCFNLHFDILIHVGFFFSSKACCFDFIIFCICHITVVSFFN